MSIVADLTKKGLMQPPTWLPESVQYETLMGSYVYGCSTDMSDKDIYGFCIPPLDMIFPHLRGEIPDFGSQIQRFGVFQNHHMKDGDATYDVSIYSITKYFQLLMENNPNMCDSLWVPDEFVLTNTKVSKMVRENKKMFLHKGGYYKYLGYAKSQLAKIKNKTGHENPRRDNDIQKFGYDLKYSYHCIRLMSEIEQILNYGDFDLQHDKELLKEIRAGKFTMEEFEKLFIEKDKLMLKAFENSKLPDKPNEFKIKELLVNCLEEYYGKLEFLHYDG